MLVDVHVDAVILKNVLDFLQIVVVHNAINVDAIVTCCYVYCFFVGESIVEELWWFSEGCVVDLCREGVHVEVEVAKWAQNVDDGLVG